MRLHRHRGGEILQVNRINEYSDLVPRDYPPVRHRTEVLRSCEKCGRPYVQTLKGNWTAEAIQRASEE